MAILLYIYSSRLCIYSSSETGHTEILTFQVLNLNLEDQGQSLPKTTARDLNEIILHIRSKFGDPSFNGLRVMAQDKLGVDTWPHSQTQAMTIPMGQNWPQVKPCRDECLINIKMNMSICLKHNNHEYLTFKTKDVLHHTLTKDQSACFTKLFCNSPFHKISTSWCERSFVGMHRQAFSSQASGLHCSGSHPKNFSLTFISNTTQSIDLYHRGQSGFHNFINPG